MALARGRGRADDRWRRYTAQRRRTARSAPENRPLRLHDNLARTERDRGGADEYSGLDMLLFVNLTDQPLQDPMLGIDPADLDSSFTTYLRKGGYSNDPQFGGPGPEILEALDAHDVWATLIPEGGTLFNATLGGPLTPDLAGIRLENGEFVYLKAGPNGCVWDFDEPTDGDVDGLDLPSFMAGQLEEDDLLSFADEFGRTDCQ